MTSKPQLMEGKRDAQMMHFPERAQQRRWETPLNMCRWIVEDTARRVAESKELFPWKFLRGDCHSHTQHSDGIGTVAETAEMVAAAGLDFQFVTDHWGLTQAPECAQHGLWVGQEPATRDHHLGILGLDAVFTPQMDFLADYHAAQQAGATVFVPHPTGWWPRTVYSEAQKQLLEELTEPFLMEICNGANNIVSAWDYTDESALQLWDHLLCRGQVVHAMGNTDAHAPHAIGMVWNGVFAPRCTQSSVLKALRAGRSFASDGPLVHLRMGAAEMGQRAAARAPLEITAVDSRGLAEVVVIADGRECKRWTPRGASWREEYALPARVRRYVRVQVLGRDGRRAVSNPIYLPDEV